MARQSDFPTKIICPNTSNIVHRPRLFDKINFARNNSRLIWVAAPSGSGKTTLVSSYITQKKITHCWYQADKEDNELATFFYYLGLAAKRASPRRKKAFLKFTPEFEQGIFAFARLFFTDIASRLKYDGLIVIDNFQFFSDNELITSLLPCISDALPNGISLIVLSQHLPPDSLDNLKIKRQLSVIAAQSLRFNEEEWMSASRIFDSQRSNDELRLLHKKLDGWIAGLILTPKSALISKTADSSDLGIELLDNYITNQFLSSLNEETTGLLLKTCYMPHITKNSAIELTKNIHAGKLLTRLAEKNLFVLRQGNKGFSVHPLIREYLQERIKKYLSYSQINELRLITAESLLNDKDYTSAIEIYYDLENWNRLKFVVLEYASALFDTGRSNYLQHYIDALPGEYIQNEPWLLFWKAKISSYRNAATSLELFNLAYEKFFNNKDYNGCYHTWFSATSLICSTLISGNQLTTWIKRHDELDFLHATLPSEIEKDSIDTLLLHCYVFSGKNPDKRIALHKKIANVITAKSSVENQLQIIANYTIISAATGIQEQDVTIIKQFKEKLNNYKTDPVQYLGSAIYYSIGLWSLNAFEKQLEFIEHTLIYAEKVGISIFNNHYYTHMVIAALGLNKLSTAKIYLEKLRLNAQNNDPVCQSLFMTCLIIAATNHQEYAKEVDKIADQFLQELDKTHITPFIIHHKLLYIYYLCSTKNFKKAMELHDDILNLCKTSVFQGQLARFYFSYAKIFSDAGRNKQSQEYIANGFLAARQGNIITCCYWPPKLLSWACQNALNSNIEIEFVTRIVKFHYFNLSSPSSLCPLWPWPYKIKSFGRFLLESDYQKQAQCTHTKTLMKLLQKLVISNKSGLTSNELKEKLYIDETHKKASQLLDTQIHRLRKMLENDNTIQRADDMIKLNLKFFWIDANEFEELCKADITEKNARQIAERIQEIYQGCYMPDDEDLEIIAKRERYRNMYLATLFKCFSHMRKDTETAIKVCQNALVLEPLSEALYRKLILIYLWQGNRDMAETTFHQCQTILKHHFGIDVSEETRSILRRNIETVTTLHA